MISCFGECCNTGLLGSSTNAVWTTKCGAFFFFAPKQMSILRVKGTNLRFPNRAHHSLHAEAFNAESINSVGTLFFCAVIHSYAGPG